MPQYVVEYLAVGRVLAHQVEHALALHDLVEAHDVLVIERLHDVDLAIDARQVRLVQALLLNALDGHLVARQLVHGQLAYGEVAVANRCRDLVRADDAVRLR